MTARRIAISGCSGGGKSTLLAKLARCGFATVPEPGRRIVGSGGPMPWNDPAGFARRAVEIALAEYARLECAWPALGYQVDLLPKLAVEARAGFVLARI